MPSPFDTNLVQNDMALFWCQDTRTKLVQKNGMAKQDDYVRITLRLPPDLHRQLTTLAGAASLNAYIVSLLSQSASVEGAVRDSQQVERGVPIHDEDPLIRDLESRVRRAVIDAFEAA
ncbi:MAG: hypothetical protein DI607_13525, partial [Sphingomonas hengshuiensis]